MATVYTGSFQYPQPRCTCSVQVVCDACTVSSKTHQKPRHGVEPGAEKPMRQSCHEHSVFQQPCGACRTQRGRYRKRYNAKLKEQKR